MTTLTGRRPDRRLHPVHAARRVRLRGYDVTLVTDAHTTEDLSAFGAPIPDKVIAHTNLYWQWQSAPGRTAATAETEKVDFSA
ncbi:hypothetical protein QLQ12_39740 [Actinoplanes sp. NEAU-A12]|uniref:Isochorismatase-like domain-containing protein n=1 Tax=Actinoplanes sandaracinus TaxID=3045177 RepID=A0ABT6WYC3_9ACTN|nr:hypothetical protein [Actinoplanes sandaracinus]